MTFTLLQAVKHLRTQRTGMVQTAVRSTIPFVHFAHAPAQDQYEFIYRVLLAWVDQFEAKLSETERRDSVVVRRTTAPKELKVRQRASRCLAHPPQISAKPQEVGQITINTGTCIRQYHFHHSINLSDESSDAPAPPAKRTATLDLEAKSLRRHESSDLNSSTDNLHSPRKQSTRSESSDDAPPAPSKASDSQFGFAEEPPVPLKNNAEAFPRKVTAFEPPKLSDKPASAAVTYGFDDTEDNSSIPLPAKQATPVVPVKAAAAAVSAKPVASVNFEFDDMDEDYPVPVPPKSGPASAPAPPPKSEPALVPPPPALAFVAHELQHSLKRRRADSEYDEDMFGFSV